MKETARRRCIYSAAGLDLGTRLTATAIAKEWIFALASTTLELMKPPYDYKSSKAQES